MSRFELVRTDADQPWHARFRASNGAIVWTTENYARRKRALRAIEIIVDGFQGAWLEMFWDERTQSFREAVVYRASSWEKRNGRLIEVREIDEREVQS